MRTALRWLLLCGIPLILRHPADAQLQPVPPASTHSLAWTTEAVSSRFVAVHGRRALVMGYPEQGLEVWAYPLQLVTGYRISFLPEGSAESYTGEALLRRTEYRPEEVIRTYVGPDFVVHESLFVPLNEPGAIVHYEVEGSRALRIRVRFVPSLNLMWPGALGGQGVQWNDALKGYVLSEPLEGNTATIASPEAVAHEPVVNRTRRLNEDEASGAEALVLQPRAPTPDAAADLARGADLYIGYDAPGTQPAAGIIARLKSRGTLMHAEAVAHYGQLLGTDTLQIETPDPELNRALAWAEIALDQAWVCNTALGCGEVAGYGPSRPARRPQYAWFFAGDGLVAVEGLLAAGEYDRAREELAFILKYQNAETGMLWHEISPGVSLNEWEHRYPYMFVHVDITYAFLATLRSYIETSGDVAFLKANWDKVERAHRYCASLLDPATGLPRIPPGREGSNEQEQMRDDIALSSEWIAAAEGFSEMATLLGNTSEAAAAAAEAEKAKHSVSALDWDPERGYWIAGHTVAGDAIRSLRPHPGEVLSQGIFTPAQTLQALDKLVSPYFQTDWGTRSLSAASPDFKPDSYAGGSVSALGTAGLAETLWKQGFNLPAYQLWRDLLPWNTLDSPGHMHEVLAGDLYHPEVESVPEQTWSSAGYLRATVRGLLGLEVDAAHRKVTFAPHLPPEWSSVTVRNLRVAGSELTLQLTSTHNRMALTVETTGEPINLSFRPELPLGADLGQVTVAGPDGKRERQHADLERRAGEEHAVVTFETQAKRTQCLVAYKGGVQVILPGSAPQVGEASLQIRVGAVELHDHTLALDTYTIGGGDGVLLQTAWIPVAEPGFKITEQGTGLFKIERDPPGLRAAPSGYLRSRLLVTLKER